MEESQAFIEDYIKFVSDNIAKFESIGDLVRMNEVPMDKVYKALANYYNVCLALNSLYQREKIAKADAEIEWDAVYASWFQEAKSTLYEQNAEKKAKPALKEIEQQIIAAHRDEYFQWRRKIAAAEARCDFFVRMRETLYKYDGILTAIASSMRSEMRALNIENRAEDRTQRLGGSAPIVDKRPPLRG